MEAATTLAVLPRIKLGAEGLDVSNQAGLCGNVGDLPEMIRLIHHVLPFFDTSSVVIFRMIPILYEGAVKACCSFLESYICVSSAKAELCYITWSKIMFTANVILVSTTSPFKVEYLQGKLCRWFS